MLPSLIPSWVGLTPSNINTKPAHYIMSRLSSTMNVQDISLAISILIVSDKIPFIVTRVPLRFLIASDSCETSYLPPHPIVTSSCNCLLRYLIYV